jgi:predicted nucleic acid-binding protein
MPSKPTLLYWDSCVFLSAIQRTAGRYATLKAILDSAAADEIVIVTSALTIAEVVKLDCDSADPDQSAKDVAEIRHFFENDYLAIKNVDRLIAEQAGDIVRRHGLKPPDAIHVATALSSKCDRLETYDKLILRLDKKVGWPILPISLPRDLDEESYPLLSQELPELPPT